MNCGHPFFGHEKFCPDCGQKNKGKRITFINFIKEVFNGFISWDAKFWQTLFPLLLKPGKVSKDFIEGKRARYSNPFQFYISVSLLFFLILGSVHKYHAFQELTTGKSNNSTDNFNFVKVTKDQKDLDSVTMEASKSLDKVLERVKVDSIERKKISDLVKNNINNPKSTISLDNPFSIGGKGKISNMLEFQRKYPKISVDTALDSLQYTKNFGNRFVYSKCKVINSWMSDTDKGNQDFSRELISYASISIFIFLPIFTLFLSFLYLRRRFTYVEHLIFVFHVQTVFFLLLIIFYLLNFVTENNNLILIFILLFLLYLFIALKKFYQQGFFKTFIKFIILNQIYLFLAAIGVVLVAAITFAFY